MTIATWRVRRRLCFARARHELPHTGDGGMPIRASTMLLGHVCVRVGAASKCPSELKVRTSPGAETHSQVFPSAVTEAPDRCRRSSSPQPWSTAVLTATPRERYLFQYVHACVCENVCIYLSLYLSVYVCVCENICIYLSLYLSVHLSVYLSICS